jgi:hypothetical protein
MSSLPAKKQCKKSDQRSQHFRLDHWIFRTPTFTKIQLLFENMKTPIWLSRNGVLSHLRMGATAVLILAAAAIAFFAAFGPRAGLAEAQLAPKRMPLPPIAPKKGAYPNFATTAVAPTSPWQLLTNQPPVLDYTDCGPGNPILLTDGTVMLQMTAARIGGS